MRLKTALLACALTLGMSGTAAARQITSIRLESTITYPEDRWIQIRELQAFADGVNLAAASAGGRADSDSLYNETVLPIKAIDGSIVPGNMYHSFNRVGDFITITLARRADVTRIVYYGRTDCCRNRDRLKYTLYDGNTVVGTGILDATVDSPTTLNLESDPTPSAWSTSSWSAWSTTCGSALRTRTVQCVNPDSGNARPEASCTATKPTTSETSYQTSGCSYAWQQGAWGSPAPACGQTTQSRTVSCRRSDDQDADPAQCDQATRPATTQSTTSYDLCTYAWTADPWSAPSTTCGQATQTRAVSCWRSDQSAVEDARCDAATRPATTQSTYQTSGCGYAWKTGGWSGAVPACGPTVENRSVTCERSDGQPAADEQCPPQDRPASTRDTTSYSTCGYSWEAGSWTSPTRTCGSSTRTRTVSCLRSDGTTVADASCTSTRPATVETVADFSTCTHSWSYGEWGAIPAACGSTTQSRDATCIRQDGVAVDGSLCGAPEPLVRPATDYSSCTYRWDAGGWSTPSACGTTTRTRTVSCLRSDGTTSGDASCDAATRPSSSEQVSDVTACQFSWVQTSVGSWGPCVSSSQTRPVSAECRRSDGVTVSDANCGSGRPPMEESRACTSPDAPPVTGQPGTSTGQIIFRRVLDVSPK